MRLLGSIPPAELAEHLDAQQANGVIQPAKLAEEIRLERRKAGQKKQLKSTPEQLAQRRARYYRSKATKPGKPKPSPSQKFERFWTQVEKLLVRFFDVEDLEKVPFYWDREFAKFRMEAIQARQERKAALANLTKKQPPEAVGATPGDE
jgi:hypothetical protein